MKLPLFLLAVVAIGIVPHPARPQVPAVSAEPEIPTQAGATGAGKDVTSEITLRDDHPGHLFADIETTKGIVEAELDFRHAPLTVMNFVGLAEGTLPFKGRPPASPFYDGIIFHRLVPGFVAQTGDPGTTDPAVPADQWGEGGPGYSWPDEFDPHLRHDAAGVVQMANGGPDTNGSQFCLMLGAANRLNYLHNVFGQVVRGLDVLQRLERGDKILHVTIRRPARIPAPAPISADPAAPSEASLADYRATPEAFEALKRQVIARRRPAAPAGFVYLLDETGQLPEFRVNNFNYKLANYERATGHRIVVRVLREFAPAKPDQTVGNAVKIHAEDLQLPDTGDSVLAVYYAKPDGAWSLRLGEKTYPALIGEPGTTEQLMASGTLHRRKTELLATAQDLAIAGKIKESVDAVIDTLILTMDDYTLKNLPAR